MASAWYNKGKAEIGNGGVVWLTDTIKVMLVSSAYTFNPDHNFISDVVASEIAVGGYTGGFGGAGRKTLANKTVTEDDTNDKAVFDADDVTWTALAAGATIGGIVIVKEITNDGASKLIAFLDPADLPTNGSDVQAQFDATGILQMT